MLGSDQAQRSNAVGHNPSYLPDADPGRHGGNTYTGASTEPTIQDYENFFGPSARDIKTDLQRFKRHGRWHLPDILKGPNPWLTDRIDGLITDATNSPFTTKILPYRYKDEVDGKIKWNVWNFDEGMASRVPYESAARTLQQSKRSFAGYMVRQGMAIVLEHNFMMTPKGRENFKNQLNQLIGSIQYTNDLDVHMALVLAPSYQKTMRERYYSLDKSPSQICREFVDLFGMMQKNVNALDILIEEGKAILRTWGGPMPDFLLCNSKLTFQMTMTPEKTNYITQGTDGVKRLRQGPDLGVYRGLSVIHSRSFAMEVGQHPRDILRRRVRTAEYYRILPDKNNVKREFEFYNEERDTWFTLTFQDLLRYARYQHEGDSGDNPAAVDRAFNLLSASTDHKTRQAFAIPQVNSLGKHAMTSLGAYPQSGELLRSEIDFMQDCSDLFEDLTLNRMGNLFRHSTIVIDQSSLMWNFTNPCFDMGIKHIYPKNNRIWSEWKRIFAQNQDKIPENFPRSMVMASLNVEPKLSKTMMADLFHSLKNVALNDPFSPGNIAVPKSPEWYTAFAFYTEIYKRSGVPMGYFDDSVFALGLDRIGVLSYAGNYNILMAGLRLKEKIPDKKDVDITRQILGVFGATGSVNHPLFLDITTAPNRGNRFDTDINTLTGEFLLTYEMISPLLRQYTISGRKKLGIEIMKEMAEAPSQEFIYFSNQIFAVAAAFTENVLDNTLRIARPFLDFFKILDRVQLNDSDVSDATYLARNGINTLPLGLTSVSHIFHPFHQNALGVDEHFEQVIQSCRQLLRNSSGHLSIPVVEQLSTLTDDPRATHIMWTKNQLLEPIARGAIPTNFDNVKKFWDNIHTRLYIDPVISHPAVNTLTQDEYLQNMPIVQHEFEVLNLPEGTVLPITNSIAPSGLSAISIDVGRHFQDQDPPIPPNEKSVPHDDLARMQDVEIVVIRPNIEHNMLGVIMGQGGETLGNTLWGQTELSVYDDSMHGIWGMSYKYHERAIVFNEKNLIRLWDIAYDGYNGGKDDTYVDWLNPDAPNGYHNFKEMTLDVSKNYRGPSMMVMAYVHNKDRRDDAGVSLFDKHFRRNWPSPIVFHDSRAGSAHHGADKETLPVDYDNLQVIDVDEFRVFNNPLYAESYGQYRALMPHFHEMHLMRKTAGQSSAESETQTDSLAFQGSMRIKENGLLVQEIHGSGHHGPDYTGVASVRAGKGQKTAGQAPTLHRLI